MTEESDFKLLHRVGSLPVGFVAGPTYPLQALLLLQKTPQLWGCVAIPIMVNVAIGAALYAGLLLPAWRGIGQWASGIPLWLAQWVAGLPSWASRLLTWVPTGATFLDDVLRFLLAIALFVLTGLLLVQFGAILGAPWYGNLAEQTERLRMGQLPIGSPSLSRAVQDIWRAITFQLKKLLLTLVLGLPLLVLNFLPPVGTAIASVGGVALAALLVGLDFLDAPLERRRLSFRRKLGVFGRSLPASATFSWSCLVLVSIPFVSLLAVPICVAAGTLFCCDRVLPYLPESQDPESSIQS
ncbi:EI24 domain-containing protein [Stenomitos frigidus AS-A4]|uniref:EI24 domain-containing protein n=2 Tax=Stenomitos TaxID=1844270 RepID=A0ABV0KQU7_9CYAN|nr:EI24 domain-containing protein [Phormidium sp. FACHB-592]